MLYILLRTLLLLHTVPGPIRKLHEQATRNCACRSKMYWTSSLQALGKGKRNSGGEVCRKCLLTRHPRLLACVENVFLPYSPSSYFSENGLGHTSLASGQEAFRRTCEQETYHSVPFLPTNVSFKNYYLNFQEHYKLGTE